MESAFHKMNCRIGFFLERSAPVGLSAAYFFRLQGGLKFDDDTCTELESNQQFSSVFGGLYQFAAFLSIQLTKT